MWLHIIVTYPIPIYIYIYSDVEEIQKNLDKDENKRKLLTSKWHIYPFIKLYYWGTMEDKFDEYDN